MSETVSYYENSKEIENKIWDLLSNAVKDRSSEFRTPVFICGNEEDLDGRGSVEQAPLSEGRQLVMLLSPAKTK